MLQSDIVRLVLSNGSVTRRLEDVGTQAHGLVLWRAHFVVLSSATGAVNLVSRGNGSVQQLWQVSCMAARYIAVRSHKC